MKFVNLSEPHNFGRTVKRIQAQDSNLICKPRSCYFENLFFGKHGSIITEILADVPDFKNLAQLEFLNITGKESVAKEIISNLSYFDSENFRRSFAYLVAYACFFGITDLFSENIIPCDSSPAVVDVECVFNDLDHPVQTLLFPSAGLKAESTIFWHFVKPGINLSENELVEFAQWQIEAFELLVSRKEKLVKYIESKKDEYYDIPIRVLLRHSADYQKSSTKSGSGIPFIREEVVQFFRGDIPYFFRTLSNPKIQWFIDENSVSSEILPKSAESPIFNNVLQIMSFDRMSDSSRIEKLQLLSLMYSIRSLMNFHSITSFYITFKNGYLKTNEDGLLTGKCGEEILSLNSSFVDFSNQ